MPETQRSIVSIEPGIWRSRWIDNAINKLNCIMEPSKRVRVPRPEGIIMYMRGNYRLVHLRSAQRDYLFTLSRHEDLDRSREKGRNTVFYRRLGLLRRIKPAFSRFA